MTAVLPAAGGGAVFDFTLPAQLAATAPPEARGLARDAVRLLVAQASTGRLTHARFFDLPRFLAAGDLVVINTSATLPAALPAEADGNVVRLHLSTRVPGSSTAQARQRWVVEVRQPDGANSRPSRRGRAGLRLALPAGGTATLDAPYPDATAADSRLWTATLALPAPLTRYLHAYGHPIRYGATRAWPLERYQTVYADQPGSAEMPSAGRPFSSAVLAALRQARVAVAPLLLHTGVSSPEAGEAPYPEWFRVPPATADRVNRTRVRGGRVVAVGTTVTRALETVASADGTVAAAEGWTDLVVNPQRGVRVVGGLITGWHEPRASHLSLLEAVAGREILARSYGAALAAGYRWHEFGDSHVLLPRAAAGRRLTAAGGGRPLAAGAAPPS